MDIVWQLRTQSERFDSQESKLARFILDNLHTSEQATMESLSAKAGVSPDALKNFSKSAGYPNLDDFLHQIRKASRQETSFTNVIRAQQPSLSQQENRVAEAILRDPLFASSATIEQLAGRAEVSAATITRFVRSVGCEDIRDLRMKLARGIPSKSTAQVESIPEVRAITQALNQQSALVSEAIWEQAVFVLRKARTVLLIGGAGESTPLIQEVQLRLTRSGLPIAWIQDENLLHLTLGRLKPDDLLLILAPDKINSNLLSAVHHAIIQQTSVIALCPGNIKLAEQARFWLPLPEAEDGRRYGILFALDKLEKILGRSNTD